MDGERPWVSASDLAEYAYCPRSYWYGEHPPAHIPASQTRSEELRGVRFHRRALGAERSRDSRAGLYLALVFTAIALLSVAYALYRFG
ncbi:MAG: hypothetical protein ACREB9_02385 [Thermoplasmata archaeon]